MFRTEVIKRVNYTDKKKNYFMKLKVHENVAIPIL